MSILKPNKLWPSIKIKITPDEFRVLGPYDSLFNAEEEAVVWKKKKYVLGVAIICSFRRTLRRDKHDME